MLDFTRDTIDEFSSSIPPEPAASVAGADDQALLDAYSNAVISVTERIGPAVVRVEVGPKTPQAHERGGLGSGIVISPDGVSAHQQPCGRQFQADQVARHRGCRH